jgi:type IV pilus biogenesis/stability protein PilW
LIRLGCRRLLFLTKKLKNLFIPSLPQVIPILIWIIYPAFFILLFFACATTPTIEDIKKADAHYKLGISYITKGELKEAFIEFQKSIRLNPKNKEALNYLGYISTRFKKYDEAISYYKRAISIDPNYSEAMNNLGVTYLEIENWDEAIKYFKKALDNPIYPTPEKAYSSMGYAYYKKGEYQKAVDTLKEALTRNPVFPLAIYTLGLVYTKLGNDEAAIEEFKRAINIVPDYVEAHWELANAYLRIGERDKAVEHFKIVAEKSGDTKIGKDALEYVELLER